MSTWVLLRGLARESRHWGDFPRRLAQHLPGERVLALDLPGNGTRWRDRSRTRIAAAVEDVRTALAQAGHGPPYRLLALSMGGMAAVHWAHAHPRELEGCVLLNTSFGRFSPLWQRLRPAAVRELGSLLLRPSNALAREAAILRLTSNRPPDAAVAQAWAQHALSAPVTRANVLRQLLAAARFRAPPRAPDVPMLLLASRMDRLVSVQCSRAIAHAWRLPLREHPSAGHDLPLDDAEWVIRSILDWRDARSD